MSVKRATRFLNSVLVISIILVCAAVVLAAVEELFHPFAPWIRQAGKWFVKTETLLNGKSLMGISFGMIVLTIIVCLIPLFMPRVSRQQYKTNTIRGVIASVVFFFTQSMYTWAERYGKLQLIGAMIVAIIVTMIVIEFLSLLTRVDEEVSLRTDLLAAAASGLASGIVIKLISVLVTIFRA